MKRILSLALCIVFFLSFLASCKSAEKPLSAAELFSLGEKYLLEMNYEQAVVQFLKVIEVEPMNPRGYTGAADAYVGVGEIDKAINLLNDGLNILPNNADILAKMDEIAEENEKESESTSSQDAMNETHTLEKAESTFDDIMQRAKQNSKLIDFDSVNYLGHSVIGLNIAEMQAIAENHGYYISTNDELDSKDEYWWFSATTDRYELDPHISVLQYHSDHSPGFWGYNHYPHTDPNLAMSIGVGDIISCETLLVFFSKWGFANTDEIANHLLSYYGKTGDSWDELGFRWYGIIDNYFIDIQQGSAISLDDGTMQLTGSWRVSLSPIDYQRIYLDFEFEHNRLRTYNFRQYTE